MLDITMPRLSGLQVARQLQQRGSPLAHIVFLTMHNERDMFDKAMEAGAKGYVLKESAVTDIVESIRTVATGRHYLSPGISHYLVQRAEHQETFRKTQSGLDSLTSAERRVLKLISLDRTSKEIADELGVSSRTIEAHRQNICNKLALHGSQFVTIRFRSSGGVVNHSEQGVYEEVGLLPPAEPRSRGVSSTLVGTRAFLSVAINRRLPAPATLRAKH